jgi:acetylornithine/N-succinyldiaminopimelate aminotransferase
VCNLGVLIPSQEFMTRVRDACRKHGTLSVMDEVATGFGRTGKLFASEHFKLDPDVLCLAKAITAGFAPMGATLVTKAVADAAGVAFYSTYGWHPLSVAAALANLRYWSMNSAALLANVESQSDFFRARLSAMKFAEQASVRIMGLAIGIEFSERSLYASRLGERCREAGLLVSTEDDNLLTMFPALTIDRKTVREGLDILEGCL